MVPTNSLLDLDERDCWSPGQIGLEVLRVLDSQVASIVKSPQSPWARGRCVDPLDDRKWSVQGTPTLADVASN
jgi:hypothetical protein